MMKEYKLASLPQWAHSFDKIVFRRMVSDLSHRHLTLAALVTSSGLRRQEVQDFLDALQSQGLLQERDCQPSFTPPPAIWDSLVRLSHRLRRWFAIMPDHS